MDNHAPRQRFSAFECEVLHYYAVVCLLLSTVLLCLSIYRLEKIGHTALLFGSLTINILTALMSLFLFFRPHWWLLWTALHVTQGLKVGLWHEELLGLLIYTMGWVIAYKAGFFRAAPKRKIALIIVIFVAMLAYQLRVSVFDFFLDFAKMVLFGTLLSLFSALFSKRLPSKKMIHKNAPANAKKPLHLSEYQLNKYQLRYIEALNDNTPYKSLAAELAVSESTVKNGMRELFRKFGMSSRNQLRDFLQTRELFFPTGGYKTPAPDLKS